MTWLLSKLMGYAWPAVAAVVAALLLAVGVQTHRVKVAKQETAEVQKAWTLDRANATAAALAQETAYRAEEQRRIAAHQEIVDEADRKILAARADAVVADAVAGRLQQRVASLVAQARAAASNPGIAQAGAPADDAAGVLAIMQRRADEAAGKFADFADRASIAGQACERAYEALTAAQ